MIYRDTGRDLSLPLCKIYFSLMGGCASPSSQAPPLAGWLSPPPLPPPPRDRQGGRRPLAAQNGERTKGVANGSWQEEGIHLGTQGAGLAAVGLPTPPPGFYWGKKLIRASEFRPWWRIGMQGTVAGAWGGGGKESKFPRETQMIYAPCTQLRD